MFHSHACLHTTFNINSLACLLKFPLLFVYENFGLFHEQRASV